MGGRRRRREGRQDRRRTKQNGDSRSPMQCVGLITSLYPTGRGVGCHIHVTPAFSVMADCFPHTRALLSALGRRYKGVNDDEHRLVGKVVSLLVDEKEDELKGLLEVTYGMDGQAVGRQ